MAAALARRALVDAACQTGRMTQPHPHEGAAYRILELPDGTFGVEVSVPGSRPTKVSGLTDRPSAERWIARHQERIAAGAVSRSPFSKRKR